MLVRVACHARYSELLGASEVTAELGDDCTVAALVDALRQMPGGDLFPDRVMVAVGRRIAEPDHRLTPGDEVAILPPFAGG